MKNMFELTLKRQAEKLKKNKQIKKAIAIVRDGVKKQPSVDLYTYLGVLYFDNGDLLYAAHSFAKALDIYEGPQPPTLLFGFLENDVKKTNADAVRLTYDLAMLPDVDNQLRFKLYRTIIHKLFVGEKTKLTAEEVFELHKKILNNIPLVQIDKVSPHKNKDVMILCSQFLSLFHGPTLVAISMAKHVKEMGWNPILLCLNTMDTDAKYSKGGFLPNTGLHQHYAKHADFNLENNTVMTPGEYPFSTVKYQNEQYPFFFIDIPFNEKCERLPYMFSDAINNENIMISLGASDIFFDVLGRYTKVYMLPLSFGLPYTMTNYPVLCRKLTLDEKKSIKEMDLYSNGIVESHPIYHLRFQYEKMDRSVLSERLEIIIVGHRLELEIEELFIQRMAAIKTRYPYVYFKFIGNIKNKDIFIGKLSAAGIFKENIFLAGSSSNMRVSLEGITFYLNPRRLGGGTSSMEALSLGIPIITYPMGDVYHACGEKFGFANDSDMLKFMDDYLMNVSVRHEVSEYCEQRYHINTNFKQVITDLTRGEIQ